MCVHDFAQVEHIKWICRKKRIKFHICLILFLHSCLTKQLFIVIDVPFKHNLWCVCVSIYLSIYLSIIKHKSKPHIATKTFMIIKQYNILNNLNLVLPED